MWDASVTILTLAPGQEQVSKNPANMRAFRAWNRVCNTLIAGSIPAVASLRELSHYGLKSMVRSSFFIIFGAWILVNSVMRGSAPYSPEHTFALLPLFCYAGPSLC